MKLILISDIHLGYNENSFKVFEKFIISLKGMDFDYLLIAGDTASNKCNHNFETAFRTIRKHLPHKTIKVLGNHDYWEADRYKRVSTLSEIKKAHQLIFKKYNIQTTSHEPYLLGKGLGGKSVLLFTHDSYYKELPERANDIYNMSTESIKELITSSKSSFNEVIKKVEKYKSEDNRLIFMSHFPFHDRSNKDNKDPGFLGDLDKFPIICKNFHYFFHGHDHTIHDFIENECRVTNAGGMQNNHKFKIIEI